MDDTKIKEYCISEINLRYIQKKENEDLGLLKQNIKFEESILKKRLLNDDNVHFCYYVDLGDIRYYIIPKYSVQKKILMKIH